MSEEAQLVLDIAYTYAMLAVAYWALKKIWYTRNHNGEPR